MVPSPTYFELLLEFIRGCVLASTLFNTCIDWILAKMSDRSTCGASLGNIKISDLDFADDAVNLAETLDVLVGALEALNEESDPLGLWVPWVKTKIQAFHDILDAAILSVLVCGEDVEVTERFTYFSSDIHVSAGCDLKVNTCLGRAWGVMDSLDHRVWRCRYLCRRTKV